MAMEDLGTDGILIHMLLGQLKPGDIPADVRDASIRKMVEVYFPPNTVMVTGYGFDMLYAGPREAVLHAVFRQNCGCSHLIVGRDHAGVGDYYGGFDAQAIFDEEEPDHDAEKDGLVADQDACHDEPVIRRQVHPLRDDVRGKRDEPAHEQPQERHAEDEHQQHPIAPEQAQIVGGEHTRGPDQAYPHWEYSPRTTKRSIERIAQNTAPATAKAP